MMLSFVYTAFRIDGFLENLSAKADETVK